MLIQANLLIFQEALLNFDLLFKVNQLLWELKLILLSFNLIQVELLTLACVELPQTTLLSLLDMELPERMSSTGL